MSRPRFHLATAAMATVLGFAVSLPTGFAQDVKAPQKLPAVEKPSGLHIVAPWARATPGGAKVGAAFLEIHAMAGADDKLIAAASPVAQAVELHDHIKDGGIMRMRRIEAIAVAGGKSVTLKPGGLHLMLMELKAPLVEGETVELTLTFEKAGVIKVKAAVQKLGAMSGPAEAGSGPGSGTDHGPGSGSGPGMKH